MPTYVNYGDPICINNTIFLFQEPKAVDFYIDVTDYPKLVQSASTPIWGGNVLETFTQTGVGTVTLTKWKEAAMIKIIPTTAITTIKFNDAASTVNTLVQGIPLIVRPHQRIKTIIVTDGNCVVEVLKVDDMI